MRNLYIFFVTIILLNSCKKSRVEKPLWINVSEHINWPTDSLVLNSEENNWEATLFSFSQPIALKIKKCAKGFVVFAESQNGITEGAAILVLKHGLQQFSYTFNLKNSIVDSIQMKDYRSPKTVNVDSSLHQQSIRFEVDSWRNIKHTYSEYDNYLEPKVGVFQAQENNALSAFYVQAGSVKKIVLHAEFNEEDKVFEVIAGPMQDKYNNTVANGTLITFVYNDGNQTYQMESLLDNGYAKVKIPEISNLPLLLYAKVGATISQTIHLIQ